MSKKDIFDRVSVLHSVEKLRSSAQGRDGVLRLSHFPSHNSNQPLNNAFPFISYNMEAIGLNERPSDARRRLTGVLGADSEEFIAVARRRSTVSLTIPKELDKELIQDGNEGAEGRRVSVAGRRASAFSRVFALSSVSESFAEEKLRPTLINAMIFFDEPNPDVNKLREVLSERLLCIPRFRSIVRIDGSEVHFDPLPREEVDFDEHLKVVDGKKKFTENDIEQLVTDTFLTDWSASRPLWRMTLVKNLADGRSMLFIVIDHAIGDGVGLLSLCLSLFDDPSDEEYSKPMRESVTQPKTKGKSLTWSHFAISFLGGIYDGIVNTLNPPSDPESYLMIPKKELELDCPGKGLAQTRAIPVSEVKALKDKMAGTTLNDVVIAILTMAIRKYFEKTGDAALDVVLKGKGKIRGDFPVNMRRGNEGEGIDVRNIFCLASFAFPIDYSDPINAVWQCKATVDELKVSPSFYLRKILGDLLFGKTPDTVLAPKVLELMNRSTCMISNVKGPTGKATLGGYKIDDLNFTTSYLGGLYFGVLTYGGNLRVSLILDDRTKADVKQLRDCFESAYDELKDSLKDVDADKPLQMPDMTPASARVFAMLVYAAAIALPVCIAVKLRN